jgi:small multidrug resistance family-3 protein
LYAGAGIHGGGQGVLNYFWFFLAAVFEIAGCYGFYLWLRLGKSAWWVVPALASLTCFALLLTRVEAAYAGRAYAAYGGIYIIASLVWLAVVEKVRPAGSDWLGAAFCVLGASIILWGPRFQNA